MSCTGKCLIDAGVLLLIKSLLNPSAWPLQKNLNFRITCTMNLKEDSVLQQTLPGSTAFTAEPVFQQDFLDRAGYHGFSTGTGAMNCGYSSLGLSGRKSKDSSYLQ